jgi:hypothetical protein
MASQLLCFRITIAWQLLGNCFSIVSCQEIVKELPGDWQKHLAAIIVTMATTQRNRPSNAPAKYLKVS